MLGNGIHYITLPYYRALSLNCKMYTQHSILIYYNSKCIIKLQFVIVSVFILYIEINVYITY